MISIHEYLLSKASKKSSSGVDLVVSIFKEFFCEQMPEDMEGDLRKFWDASGFGTFRIWGSDISFERRMDDGRVLKDSPASWLCGKEADGFKALVFSNLLSLDIVGEVIQNMVDYGDYKDETYETDNNDYLMAMGAELLYIEETNGNAGFVFEKVQDADDTNPDINTYYVNHNEMIELSARRIMHEVDDLKDESQSESLYDTVDMLTTSYIKDFEEETDVTIKIGGKNGRHVCVDPTWENLHRYSELKKLVDSYQDDLVREINFEVENYNSQE